MTEQLTGTVMFLVTSNIHKFKEARRVLSELWISTAMLKKIDPVEIQTDNIEDVAKASAIDAVRKCNLPLVVEDAGLFIAGLDGFPGPYSSYVLKTIGNSGILKLMTDVPNRDAQFKSAVAFLSPSMDEPVCFTGIVTGEIVNAARGRRGFGFDPIFSPSNSAKTFAEMTTEEKNKHSHRALSFRAFAEWHSAKAQKS